MKRSTYMIKWMLRLFLPVLVLLGNTGCYTPHTFRPHLLDMTLAGDGQEIKVTDAHVVRFANHVRNTLRQRMTFTQVIPSRSSQVSRLLTYGQGVALIEKAEVRYLDAIATRDGVVSSQKLTADGVQFYREVLASLKVIEGAMVGQIPSAEELLAVAEARDTDRRIDVVPDVVTVPMGAQAEVAIASRDLVAMAVSNNTDIATASPHKDRPMVTIAGKKEGQATITILSRRGDKRAVQVTVVKDSTTTDATALQPVAFYPQAPGSLADIQRRLCVEADGVFGASTRRALLEYQSLANKLVLADDLYAELEEEILALEVCPEPFRTYYEFATLKAPGAITVLQEKLNTARAGGFLSMAAPLPLTGRLDEPTRNALWAFQSGHDLSPVDGLYSQATHEALSNLPERTLSEAQRKEIQRRLCVEEDGVFGPKTRRAIREYQALAGELPTGDVDEKQVARLRDLPECLRNFRTYYEFRQLSSLGAVRALQQRLNGAARSGFIALAEPLDLTDEFNQPTRDALKAFQMSSGLSQTDGLYSPETASAISGFARP